MIFKNNCKLVRKKKVDMQNIVGKKKTWYVQNYKGVQG